MKQAKRFAAAALILTVIITLLPLSAYCATVTGYTKAEDVAYTVVKGTVVNWGARGEDCTFLTSYAREFYTGSYSWDALSGKAGGTGISDAYASDLYKALQTMMKTKHTTIQGYQDTRPYYCYTDCVLNDYSKVCSFYSGTLVNGVWDSGNTYNREHIWPRSKCISTNKINDSADIMMLRATINSENGDRGNSAYGESSGYFTPDAAVRGDCARMVLYGYVRWGNTGKMWGTSGVMESLDVLLEWMAEDPVDTWEMGRNDSVESITGTRNVFVDYPEYAWLLFGEEVPTDLVTLSGEAANMTPPAVTPPVTEPPVTEPPVTDAPATEPQDTTPPTQTTVPTTQATVPGSGDDGDAPAPLSSNWIWICVAIVFVGTATVVVILLLKKKRPPVSN